MDRLDDAAAMDGRYHLAKLIANGFGEPESVWREHEAYRRQILAPHPVEPTQEDWLARVAAIHQKMQRSGLLHPNSGAVN